MSRRFERLTLVVDLATPAYATLPEYVWMFRIAWPTIVGEGKDAGKVFTLGGGERWSTF